MGLSFLHTRIGSDHEFGPRKSPTCFGYDRPDATFFLVVLKGV